MRLAALILLCFSTTLFAVNPSINIQMLKPQQNIQQILVLQKDMHMSETPKQLSDAPAAICFNANIDEFLPKTKSNKPIYGCIFSDQPAMNAALLRAGLYVHTDIGMADDQMLFSSKLMSAVGGHDFDGEELLKYHKNSEIPKKTLAEHTKFKAIETTFNKQIIVPIIKKNKGNFIFFAIINTKKFKDNLSHELLHAQYYNDPRIKPILLQVWNNVSPKDQIIIRDALQNGGYDMTQQELLLREFYSYFLQHNAQEYLAGIKVLSPMAPLAPIYSKQIQQALAASKIRVLTV